ncbi:hypothetical protein ALC152_05100 [Arcobacter sp. 15-2]|uniref:hypothetical protein n=1 Tax=Arcobacter sp. 15-2 TaxID=3374109 RepID=UPI00399C4CB4
MKVIIEQSTGNFILVRNNMYSEYLSFEDLPLDFTELFGFELEYMQCKDIFPEIYLDYAEKDVHLVVYKNGRRELLTDLKYQHIKERFKVVKYKYNTDKNLLYYVVLNQKVDSLTMKYILEKNSYSSFSKELIITEKDSEFISSFYIKKKEILFP